MAPKAYSSFFFQFPQLSPTPSLSSFLSLDVADSIKSDDDCSAYSQYSHSTSSSFFPGSIPDHPPRRSRPVLPALDTTSRSSSKSSHSSAQRALPRPKPIPRATLPDVPASAPPIYSRPNPYHRPRTTPPKSKPKIRLQSPPTPPSPEYSPATLTPPRSKQRPVSATTGTSAASTNYRRVKRTDALARLEGRDRNLVPRSFSPPPYSPSAAMNRIKSAAPVLATKSFMPFSDDDSDSDDEHDIVHGVRDVRVELVPVPPSPLFTEKKGRARRGTIESWFAGPPPSPKNFMDFEDVPVWPSDTKWRHAFI